MAEAGAEARPGQARPGQWLVGLASVWPRSDSVSTLSRPCQTSSRPRPDLVILDSVWTQSGLSLDLDRLTSLEFQITSILIDRGRVYEAEVNKVPDRGRVHEAEVRYLAMHGPWPGTGVPCLCQPGYTSVLRVRHAASYDATCGTVREGPPAMGGPVLYYSSNDS